MSKVTIIGGGLAGCEAAYQIAKRGIKVDLFELRHKEKTSFAHQSDKLAELVCSNSFRNDDLNSAIGILHQEMRYLDSIIIRIADKHRLPAGSALAMDRDQFALAVQKEITENKNITVIRQEVEELPIDKEGKFIIASGPLTSEKLSASILKHSGEDELSFFDAIAPIIYKDSIDFDKCWMQSRYDKGDGKDYINCPMNKEQYEEFINDLITGDKTEFKEWEKDTPYFEGCLPIEVMAARGVETLRFGPLKPVGLTNEHDPQNKPYAVVQLRQDNKSATLYNIVGFQTKLKYKEQERVFRKIPGLEKCEFARLGGIHRNSFINSPKLLDEKLNLKKLPNIKFAGQISGVEGYVESASMGLLCGIFSSYEILNKEITPPPPTTAIGSLLNYITHDHYSNDSKFSFQPMNVNFGIFKNLEEKVYKKARKEAYSKKALADILEWKSQIE
jgi:methylenetetrahydrofolate--tRNA-(uracil-5-)-methyltransferase